jgi:hypothetical protein
MAAAMSATDRILTLVISFSIPYEEPNGVWLLYGNGALPASECPDASSQM